VLRGAGFPDAEAVRLHHAFADQALAYGAHAGTHPHIAATARHLVADMPRGSHPGSSGPAAQRRRG
jgi:hypothetical protein